MKNLTIKQINASLSEALFFCQTNQYKKAKEIYGRLIKIIPDNTDVLTNLGSIELQIGNQEEGIKLLKRSIAINHYQTEATINLANGLYNLQKFDDALKVILSTEKIESAIIFYNKGRILKALNRINEALESYEKVLLIEKNHLFAINNMGIIFFELKQYDKALASYEQGLKINPHHTETLYNMGITYAELKQYDKALASYEQALKINPNYLEAMLNLGMLNLNLKNFKKGWSFYSKRFFLKNEKYIDFNLLKISRKILLKQEQGVGDQVLYLSMLTDLIKVNKNIDVVVDKRLKSILIRSFEATNINFFDVENNLNLNDYDLCLQIGDLGAIFRSDKESFNVQKSYLKADPEKINKYKSIFDKKLICGISWRSNNERIGNDKSIQIEKLLPIFQIPNIDFVSIQYGNVDEEIDYLKNKYNIHVKQLGNIDIYNNLDNLASLIDATDFIVTISNVNAHIAGALGKETYLLAPYSKGKIWYWHEDDTQSIWYPSVNIHRQPNLNNWSKPIDEIAHILENKKNK